MKNPFRILMLSFLIAIGLCSLHSCRKGIEMKPTQYPGITTTTADLRPTGTSVTLSTAEKLALAFLQSKHKNELVTLQQAETITKNGLPYLHVFNANNKKGFVIISSDSMYRPILAFDSLSNFNLGNVQEGLEMWLNKHEHELDFMRNTKNTYTDSIAKANKKLWVSMGHTYHVMNTSTQRDVNVKATNGLKLSYYYYPPQVIDNGTDSWTSTVGPLCLTAWTQRYPWNEYCPSGTFDGGHMAAGCVPVAMAQVMHYAGQPSGTGGYAFSSMFLHIDNTIPYTTSGYTEAARLIHDIGTTQLEDNVQLSTYGNDATSSPINGIPLVFLVFGYESTQVGSLDFPQTQGTDLAAALLADVYNNNHPAVVCGYTSYGTDVLNGPYASGIGHAWVCDGVYRIYVHPYDVIQYYDNYGNPTFTENQYTVDAYSIQDLLHMNWGLSEGALGGANNDGWYDCSINYTLAPNTHDFQYFQTAFVNIHR